MRRLTLKISPQSWVRPVKVRSLPASPAIRESIEGARSKSEANIPIKNKMKTMEIVFFIPSGLNCLSIYWANTKPIIIISVTTDVKLFAPINNARDINNKIKKSNFFVAAELMIKLAKKMMAIRLT